MIERFQVDLEEEEVPWDFDEVVESFSNFISQEREARSTSWFIKISEDEPLVTSMAAETANKLLHQLSSPPLYLTEKDWENLNALKQKVIQRLSELNIEWLIEKFKELSMAKQTEFIELASELMDK